MSLFPRRPRGEKSTFKGVFLALLVLAVFLAVMFFALAGGPSSA